MGVGWYTPDEELLDLPKLQGSASYEAHKECVNKGWHPILDSLVDWIDWHVVRGKMPPVEIFQIKEKFGGLRFYFQGGNDLTHTYVSFCETLASRVCEDCGKAASARSLKGWVRTVCDDHA